MKLCLIEPLDTHTQSRIYETEDATENRDQTQKPSVVVFNLSTNENADTHQAIDPSARGRCGSTLSSGYPPILSLQAIYTLYLIYCLHHTVTIPFHPPLLPPSSAGAPSLFYSAVRQAAVYFTCSFLVAAGLPH